MCRVFRRELVRSGRARLSTTDEPAVVIGRSNVFVVAVDHVVEVEGGLMSDAVRVAFVGLAAEGEADESQSVYFGQVGFEDRRLQFHKRTEKVERSN